MTIWIDKQNKTVVKTLNKSQSYMLRTHALLSVQTTVVYNLIELDLPQLASSFTFVPPSDAKLVEEFPDVLRNDPEAIAAKIMNKPAPELEFKAADGKVLSLSSLLGKAVLLEFWATWCAPCVDVIPDLKKLYAETQDKGLVWISIDNDNDGGTATAFLAREQVPWSNYHDEDGSFGEAFHREGIPLGVLIDRNGKVIFYKSGYEIPELRNAISKLGPEFSAIGSSVKHESKARVE
jgi:thiol-disulfide isomerase/thioredoxin